MKLHLATTSGHNAFTGYGSGYVTVNGVRHERSLVLTPQRIIEAWEVADFGRLDSGHFEFLLTLAPEIVLLGTGASLRFPPPALTQCLTAAGVGLEVMDTRAACRTYNILMAEGRNVAAAVLIA